MPDEKPEVRDRAWRCASCDNVLGYVSPDGRILRMKYKDFYVFIEEAERVITFCRRCGKESVVRQEPAPTEEAP